MKQLTTLFIFCFSLFPFLYSCTNGFLREIKGNYTIINEKIAITDYEEIVLNIAADVFYAQISQEEPFLQVTVDKNIFSSLDISVQNRRLIISQKNDSVLRPTQLKIYTNSKNLSKIDIHGSGDVFLEKEVNAKEMEIAVSGSGDVKADSLFCESLKVKIIGSGDAEIKGAATNAVFEVNGSGDIKAFDYLVNNLNCSVQGSGDIEAYVYENLIASIAGSGDLKYKGNPKSAVTDVKGSGDIKKVNE
jgi:hypothetical protein